MCDSGTGLRRCAEVAPACSDSAGDDAQPFTAGAGPEVLHSLIGVALVPVPIHALAVRDHACGALPLRQLLHERAQAGLAATRARGRVGRGDPAEDVP